MKNYNYKCTPSCPHFQSPDNPSWEWSEDGTYKVPINPFSFICRYDGHIIKSWYDDCPKNKIEKEEN